MKGPEGQHRATPWWTPPKHRLMDRALSLPWLLELLKWVHRGQAWIIFRYVVTSLPALKSR